MSIFIKNHRTVAPMGAVAVTSTFCILVGRHNYHLSSKKATQSASRYLNSYAQSKYRIRNMPSQCQNRLLSSETSTTSTITKKATSAVTKASPDVNITSSSPGGRFVAWYEHHLHARPIQTKAVTGSILWGIGDFVAQVVPSMMQPDNAVKGEEIEAAAALKKEEFEYNYPRTARAMFFGFAIHAPLSHLHFNLLEWMTVKRGFTGLSIPVFKTIMGQVRTIVYLCFGYWRMRSLFKTRLILLTWFFHRSLCIGAGSPILSTMEQWEQCKGKHFNKYMIVSQM